MTDDDPLDLPSRLRDLDAQLRSEQAHRSQDPDGPERIDSARRLASMHSKVRRRRFAHTATLATAGLVVVAGLATAAVAIPSAIENATHRFPVDRTRSSSRTPTPAPRTTSPTTPPAVPEPPVPAPQSAAAWWQSRPGQLPVVLAEAVVVLDSSGTGPTSINLPRLDHLVSLGIAVTCGQGLRRHRPARQRRCHAAADLRRLP